MPSGFKMSIKIIFYFVLFPSLYARLPVWCMRCSLGGVVDLDASGQQVVDGLASSKTLFHLDELLEAVDNKLDKLALGTLQPGSVGQVVHVINSSSVFSGCTTLLHLEANNDGIELGVLAEVLQLDVSGATQTSSDVGWAGAEVAKALTPHEFTAFLLHQTLDLFKTPAEPLKYTLHVTTLFHRDHTAMILLVHPDQEGLVLVVPDTSAIGPVTDSIGVDHQMSSGLLEEEVVLDELFLFFGGHLEQRVVGSREVSTQASKSVDQSLLDLTALSAGDGGWEAQTTDRASSTDTAGTHVFCIQLAAYKLAGIKLGCGMLIIDAKSQMMIIQDRVEDLLEGGVGFFIAGYQSDNLAGEVDRWLDALVNCDSIGSHPLVHLLIGFGCEMFADFIVVGGVDWEVLRRWAIHVVQGKAQAVALEVNFSHLGFGADI